MNTKPGILFICNSLGIGGAESHVISLLNLLDTQQFRLSLAYLKANEQLLPKLDQSRLQSVLSAKAGSKIDLAAVRRLAEQIDRDEIDILACTNNYSMMYGFLARRRARRPVKIVEIFHTTQLRTVKERLQSLLYKRLFARCDRLIYVCDNQMRHWKAQGVNLPGQIVIHNGIDTDFYTDRFSAQDKAALRSQFGFGAADYVVGICASFRPEKAHGDLLRALQALRANPSLPAKALLIGDGQQRTEIERTIVALGLQDAVRITGFQSDVRPYIAACDVMVLASHAIETFSLSALESMSMGKPLVLTRIGGADEQVEDGVNGFLYEPGDLKALTEHLAALADPALRARMGAQAARIVRQRFQVRVMVESFEREFRALASDR